MMKNSSFKSELLLKVVLLTAAAVIAAFAFVGENYILVLLALVMLVTQTVLLLRHVDQTNRKVTFFFDAIRNEDFTLHFPEELNSTTVQDLNKSLNRVNEMIRGVYQKQQEQETYYQEIIKQADIGILMINAQGHINFSNPTVEKLLNYSPLHHIKQLQQVDEKLYQLFASLVPFERKLFELTNEREKRQLALKSRNIRLQGEDSLLVVIQDIHQELDEKETDSWVRLIRVLVHEIMNTIAPVTSISESILRYFKQNEQPIPLQELSENHIASTVKGLEVIQDQGNNLMDFVQSYRSFLNVPLPDKTLIPVQKLLDRVSVLMEQYRQLYDIEFFTQIEPTDLEVYVDEKQLTQVLINLTKNAIQAMSERGKGQITIRAYLSGKEKPIIEIEDNGPGISSEQLDEVFVPFFTTKKTGTGIGLSLSKQILRLHGGNISVNSIPNEQTIFKLVLG